MNFLFITILLLPASIYASPALAPSPVEEVMYVSSLSLLLTVTPD
jgi:hypothetical protein